MPHRFPIFAKIWGWCLIAYLMNQAYMLYFWPERIVGKWGDITKYYMTYKHTNWFFAARCLALAMFGAVAQINPPKMTGCIFMFSGFFMVNIFHNIWDSMTSQWVAPSPDWRMWAKLGCLSMDCPNMVFFFINAYALH